MIRKSGGCSTTAYATTVGLSKDPTTVSVRVELVDAWLDVANHPAAPKKGHGAVWEKLAKGLACERRWSQVRGHMGAYVAMLMDPKRDTSGGPTK